MITLDTNLKNRASAQFVFPVDVNSMAKVAENKFFAASQDGLYRYTGHTDDGDPIASYFITATMDFGMGHDKRLRYLYLSLEATDDLQLIVNTEKVAAQTYTILIDTPGQQDIRIPISRALYGRFWTFKISNGSTGADFSIDEIQVLPIVRGRQH
jgi:hypothetical protein